VRGPAYAALENGVAGSEITLGAAKRLAGALGLNLDEMTTVHSGGTENEPVDDAARLGAVLMASETLTPVGSLCEILGWELERVHHAEMELARRLETVGMSLRRSMARLAITRAESAADRAEVRAATKRHLARDNVALTEARLLRYVMYGDPPTQPSNNEKKAQGVLVNAGLVSFAARWTRTAEAELVLSNDVRFSLLLDEATSSAEAAPRPDVRRQLRPADRAIHAADNRLLGLGPPGELDRATLNLGDGGQVEVAGNSQLVAPDVIDRAQRLKRLDLLRPWSLQRCVVDFGD